MFFSLNVLIHSIIVGNNYELSINVNVQNSGYQTGRPNCTSRTRFDSTASASVFDYICQIGVRRCLSPTHSLRACQVSRKEQDVNFILFLIQ